MGQFHTLNKLKMNLFALPNNWLLSICWKKCVILRVNDVFASTLGYREVFFCKLCKLETSYLVKNNCVVPSTNALQILFMNVGHLFSGPHFKLLVSLCDFYFNSWFSKPGYFMRNLWVMLINCIKFLIFFLFKVWFKNF